jgi:hypothetical protein
VLEKHAKKSGRRSLRKLAAASRVEATFQYVVLGDLAVGTSPLFVELAKRTLTELCRIKAACSG